MANGVGVEQWVAMFREIGLSDTDMHKWHVAFERSHPQGHQSFLEWLALPAERISSIRHDAAEA